MRSIWTGSLSFGLINIPVRMYSGEESEAGPHFHLLDKRDLSLVRYSRVSKKSGKEVPYKDIVKGYEYEDGDYIVLTDEDFDKANQQRQKSIDIKAFIDVHEVDERFYKKPYYLEPQKGAEGAYALLRESLARSEKAAVAKYVLRNRDHLGLVRPVDRALAMIEMRFLQEVRQPSNLNLPNAKVASKDQISLALQLIDQLTRHFVPEDYKDEYANELKNIINKKAKGKPVRVHGAQKTPAATKDIMAMLKKSLEKAGKK